jgi:hypothetical protein
MTQAFGHATAIGYSAQVAWGTAVPTPSAWLEPLQESMQLVQSAVGQPTLARSGVSRYTKSKRSVGGAISHFMPYQGAEILLKHAMGGAVSSAQIGATGVYTHTFTFADKLPTPGLTINVNRDVSAVTDSFIYDSCQIADLTLTSDVEGRMVLALEFQGRDETRDATPQTPSYGTAPEVDWTELTTLTLDDGTPVTCAARLAEFKISNPLADDRFKLGSRLRKGLGRGDHRAVTGKLALEFDSFQEYAFFQALTELAITAEFTGPEADNGEFYKISIQIPKAVMSGTTPNATEAGPINIEVPFTCFMGDSLEDEITIELTNLLTSVA